MYYNLINKVVDEVLTMFAMSDNELFSNKRKRKFADARHMMLHILNDKGIPVVELQEMMSDRAGYKMNHGVICHSIKASKDRIETDTMYRKSFNSLLKTINNHGF
jgi:chromosomal replication initiation ATPase DnaA